MAKHEVELTAHEGIFEGLAKQNMAFHECIAELIDNAIAASPDSRKFRIDVIFEKLDKNHIAVWLSDNSKGMDLDTFKEALQLGESATKEHRLNEHGFGMKNALSTLTKRGSRWSIWSSPDGVAPVNLAEGPFGPKMVIDDSSSFPDRAFLPPDTSTVIRLETELEFLQSVQGRGAPATDLSKLREWLIEHLGVLYRGYLEQDPNTGQPAGSIFVSIKRETLRVPPIPVPLGNSKTEYIEVELAGEPYTLEYRYGTLDEVQRDSLVRGKRAKFYYQKNQPTQGIDIRLGKRVISTREFETIWKTEDRARQLSRNNKYNEFLGELLIPEGVPRGVLSTTNDKTNFDLDDPDWRKIFNALNDYRPIENIRAKTEASLRDTWMEMLQATNPEDEITDERSVWPTGAQIDVYRRKPSEDIIIYELKAGNGKPQHLYQLMMYWDGLANEGVYPKEAILLVEDYNANLEEMANKMNELPSPEDSPPYNFNIEKHDDKGL